MSKIFILILCMCATGFAQHNWDNPKCYEADRIALDLARKRQAENDKKYSWAWASLLGNPFTICECAEKLACGKINFCTSFKCPGEEEAVSVFEDIQNFAEKVGGRGANSGSEQP